MHVGSAVLKKPKNFPWGFGFVLILEVSTEAFLYVNYF